MQHTFWIKSGLSAITQAHHRWARHIGQTAGKWPRGEPFYIAVIFLPLNFETFLGPCQYSFDLISCDRKSDQWRRRVLTQACWVLCKLLTREKSAVNCSQFQTLYHAGVFSAFFFWSLSTISWLNSRWQITNLGCPEHTFDKKCIYVFIFATSSESVT